MSGHDNSRSPRSQAWRGTPPSSQQYSNWTTEQREAFCSTLVENATGRLENELEIHRDNEDWYRRLYEVAVREQIIRMREPVIQPVIQPVRVAAIRHDHGYGSQGSTIRSSSSDGSQTDSQRLQNGSPNA